MSCLIFISLFYQFRALQIVVVKAFQLNIGLSTKAKLLFQEFSENIWIANGARMLTFRSCHRRNQGGLRYNISKSPLFDEELVIPNTLFIISLYVTAFSFLLCLCRVGLG